MAGFVERKKGVVKDILEKLENDKAREYKTAQENFAEACFLRKFLYGGRRASSYEMARGHSPSISGTGTFRLPSDIRTAHEELSAQILFLIILKARPDKKQGQFFIKDDKVLALLAGGKRPVDNRSKLLSKLFGKTDH